MDARGITLVMFTSLAVLAGSALAQSTIGAAIVVREGDTIAGGVVQAVNPAFTDGTGRAGTLVNLEGSRRLIIDEDLTVLFDSATVATPALTGGEGTIGISDANGYIYSPSIAGADGVFSNGTVLARGGELAPDTAGEYYTNASRPAMLPNGTAYWASGISTVQTGSPVARRAWYRNPTPANPAASTIVLEGGDTYGGLTVATSNTFFNSYVSDNELHQIHELTAAGAPAASNVYVAADNTLIAQEGSAAPVGNWTETFRIVDINNAGTWVIGGDTTFATTSQDEIIASNSGLVVQEGTVIGGTALAGTVNALSINNNGAIAFTWGSGGTEVLVTGPVATFSTGAQKLAQVNDLVDTDGNGTGDYTLIDFEASAGIGPGIDLGDDGRVFVEVTLRPIGGTSADDFGALIRFPGDPAGCPADLANAAGQGEPDGGVDINDLLFFLAAFEAGSADADLDNDGDPAAGNPDGGVDVNDLLFFLARFEAGC